MAKRAQSDITAKTVHAEINSIYDDGVVDRAEAERLFDLTRSLDPADDAVGARFREAVRDYILGRELPANCVTDEECAWLSVLIEADETEPVRDVDVDLVLDIMRFADAAPVELSHLAFRLIERQIASVGHVNADTVERVRRALFAPSGDQSTWVSRDEAATLFRINDMVNGQPNAESWNQLFARAVGNHLLACAHPEPSTVADEFDRQRWLANTEKKGASVLGKLGASIFGEGWFDKVSYSAERAAEARTAAREAALKAAEAVNAGEAGWLTRKIEEDGEVCPAEEALLRFLEDEVPGFVPALSVSS